MTEQEKFNYYDWLCQLSLAKMNKLINNNDKICLIDYKVDDENYEFIFNIALILKSINGKEIEIDLPSFTRKKFLKKYKKNLSSLKKCDNSKENVVSAAQLINIITPYGKQIFGDNFELKQIYNAYYKKG